MRAGFTKIDKQFGQVDKRFGQVDKRFAQVDKRFGQVNQQFERVFTVMHEYAMGVDEKFDKMDGRLGKMESSMATKDDLAKVESRLDAKIDGVKSAVDDVKIEVSALSKRDKEDTDAVVHEIAIVKQRLDVLEHAK